MERVNVTLRHLSTPVNNTTKTLQCNTSTASGSSLSLSFLKTKLPNLSSAKHYEADFLRPNPASIAPLTPITFLQRSATVYPNRIAIIQDNLRLTWKDVLINALQIASSLTKMGIKKGDTVSVFSPNSSAMYCLLFGIPMSSAVIGLLNTRLDPQGVAFILEHSLTKVIFVDRELSEVLDQALELLVKNGSPKPLVIEIHDPCGPSVKYRTIGDANFQDFVAQGDKDFQWIVPDDENDAMTLCYTSGTTGNPKGVVAAHRGTYLCAIGCMIDWNLPLHPVYLWTLPMFHANGWTCPHMIAALAGTNVILRQMRAGPVYDAIVKHNVTHLCGAPTVVATIANASKQEKKHFSHKVRVFIGGAPPPAAQIKLAEDEGFEIVHAYGLSETHGPCVVCAWQSEWDSLSRDDQCVMKAQQGVVLTTMERCKVVDTTTNTPVPHDGETQGEILFSGNLNTKGYFRNREATEEAFEGGWFHTGDIAVVNPNGYIKIKDRSKDVIISGGENISSIEVQDKIATHPDILQCAIVGAPHKKWGETPVAFVEVKPGAEVTEEEIIKYARDNLAHFKCPTKVIFGPLIFSATGKVQKFKLKRLVEGGKVFD